MNVVRGGDFGGGGGARGLSMDILAFGGGWLGIGGGPALGAAVAGSGGGKDGGASERGVLSSKLDSRAWVLRASL